MRRRITVDDIMRCGPCGDRYPRSRVEELVGDGLTPLEICALDITPEEIVHRLIKPNVLPREVLQTAMDAIADRAVRSHCLHCEILEVETRAALWLSHEDRTLESARAMVGATEMMPAALGVVWFATQAAWFAAQASEYVAWVGEGVAAAWFAAQAAWYVALAAAGAAGAKERLRQVEDFREAILEAEKTEKSFLKGEKQ